MTRTSHVVSQLVIELTGHNLRLMTTLSSDANCAQGSGMTGSLSARCEGDSVLTACSNITPKLHDTTGPIKCVSRRY